MNADEGEIEIQRAAVLRDSMTSHLATRHLTTRSLYFKGMS